MAATTYATVANMILSHGSDLYGALKVADGATITANTMLLAAIANANGMVDAAVRNRYDISESDVSTNELLVAIARQVAWYNLLLQTRREALTDADTEQFRENRRILNEIRNGELSLQYPPKNREQTIATPGVAKMGENATTNDTNYHTATKSDWMANY